MTLIVALAGAKQSGKSTVAKVLIEEYGFVRVSFADGLKDMLAAIGCTYDELYGSLKEAPCDILGGKTTRYAMQTLGTEWGREMIWADIWVKAIERKIFTMTCGRKDVRIVMDDLRFPNEYTMLRNNGAEIWVVHRQAALGKPNRRKRFGKRQHKSETYWQSFEAHLKLANEGSLWELQDLARSAVLTSIARLDGRTP